MKKRHFIGLLVALFFFFVPAIAQLPHVDSLKRALELHPTEDSAKIELLIKICRAHVMETNDMDQLQYYNSLLFPLSQKLHSRKGMAASYLNKGINSKIRSDYPQAMIHLNHSLLLFKEINEKPGIAAC